MQLFPKMRVLEETNMSQKSEIAKNISGGRLKYCPEYKIYVILYMREFHLTNKEAQRMFLPNQTSNSAKTIREWKKIYKDKGPLGFFKMKKQKPVKKPKITIDKNLQSKSKEELISIINDFKLIHACDQLTIELLKKR